MSLKHNVVPKILTEELTNQFRRNFEDAEVPIQSLAQSLAEIHGKDGNQVMSVTVYLAKGTPNPTAQLVMKSIKAKVCYDDGTCGCIEDPPGISFQC
ncbi:hypothetical protein SAMN05444172_8176 [Burkholderia sp. GAS332]|uniref:hypothetical protein n=1 Tax=Paraburkholderia sediminicola TaxID=458836 RepID=UPI00092A539B|nr:hypothetical protein SAMN05444172_8176 [Burkholderia sp. GAS332]